MGVPTSEVGYTSATVRRGDHESSYEHVVALEEEEEEEKSTHFTVTIFTEITTVESHRADVLCTLYYPNRTRIL